MAEVRRHPPGPDRVGRDHAVLKQDERFTRSCFGDVDVDAVGADEPPEPYIGLSRHDCPPHLEHEWPRIEQPHPGRSLVQFAHEQTMAWEGHRSIGDLTYFRRRVSQPLMLAASRAASARPRTPSLARMRAT